MTDWQDPRLEAAYDCLDDAMAETHPEHSEYDALQRARDAVEDADMALERLNNLRRGLPAQGIEAQRAGTVKQGPVHESPVAESDAPIVGHSDE